MVANISPHKCEVRLDVPAHESTKILCDAVRQMSNLNLVTTRQLLQETQRQRKTVSDTTKVRSEKPRMWKLYRTSLVLINNYQGGKMEEGDTYIIK